MRCHKNNHQILEQLFRANISVINAFVTQLILLIAALAKENMSIFTLQYSLKINALINYKQSTNLLPVCFVFVDN